MDNVILNLAGPENTMDCLEKPFHIFSPGSDFYVAYLSIDDIYLSDLNDDPTQERNYESGLFVWASCVQNLFTVLSQWSGGKPATLSLQRTGIWIKLSATVFRSKYRDHFWEVNYTPDIPAEWISSMSTFGWDAVLWTSLDVARLDLTDKEKILSSQLVSMFSTGDISWWMAHGYKEPFLGFFLPHKDLNELSPLLQKESTVPVQIETEKLFIPHRIRMHRQFL